MKPLFTFVLALLCFTLTAQVKFKVALLPDNVTYQVSIRPDVSWSAPQNTVLSAQVTVRVPTGGFNLGPITSLKGNWGHIGTVVSPTESTAYDYIIFGLQGLTSNITFQSGQEVAVFNFKNNGSCTGALELIENELDPFWPPNSQSVNIGNQIAVVGAGNGVNAYTGNFGAITADCRPLANYCGIEIFDIKLKSPSACGVADGSIEIVATATDLPPLQYSINGGITWQSSPVFSNLAAGDLFEIIVRDIAPICIVEAGQFELEGPLAAVVTGVDRVLPDCGQANGSITINAFSENGGILEYAMDENGPWQSSSTFSGLSAGTYPFYIRNITSNCSSFIGNYTLDDCPVEPCYVSYGLQDLGSGKFQVNLLSDTTWNAPNDNITSAMRVTIKVPTGGFTAGNVVSQVTNVNFALGSTFTAPAAAPGFDYINFDLISTGTQEIPYVKGASIPLFIFENTGTCTGDSLRLMTSEDPFQDANAGQKLNVSGYGPSDLPVCISGTGAVKCTTIPPPPPSCLITYQLEKLAGGEFQVSMIADTTWVFPSNITSSMQVTVKVPAGGFIASEPVDKIANVQFDLASSYTTPDEDPAHDYISFLLSSQGTTGIPYQKGVKTPLFTFTNLGTCQGGQVVLIDNDTDPFYPPNSQNANVGQQITVSGFQGADAPVCILNLPAEDCTDDPCATLSPGFLADDTCEGLSLDFSNTTTATESITSWNWDFGDNSAPSNAEAPSHTYSISGNFEVSLTVTTGSGCIATFTKFVTVFPAPGEAPFDLYSICNGENVQLQAPDGASIVWSPATGLSDPNIPNPFASPAATTVYTMTATNDFGCSNSDQVTVEVANKPIFNNVIVGNPSDCGLQDGKISIVANGVAGLEYSINNGNTWQSNATFTGLPAGNYIVQVRNATGSCPVVYNGNPVVITSPSSPVISNVAPAQPSGCASNGSITITASGGIAPLLYSINGGATYQSSNQFQGLEAGNYQVVVANADTSCLVFAPDNVTLTAGQTATIVTPVADFSLCQGTERTISIQVSQPIASFTILPVGSFSNAAFNGNTLTFKVTAGAAGTVNYTAQITTTGNCQVTEGFTLTSVAAPTASFTAPAGSCTSGNVILNYTGNASPQAGLVWSLNGGSIVTSSQQNETKPDSANITVRWATQGLKNITLTVTDHGCTAMGTGEINITNFNPDETLSVTNAACGLNNGAIDLSITGGPYSYAWSNGATSEGLSGLAGGSYQVTITENGTGCSTTASATVLASQGLTVANVTEDPATDCNGSTTDGSLSITIGGGTANYTFALFAGGNLVNPVQQVVLAQNTHTFEDLNVGAYQLKVTDANGCSAIATTAVTSTNGGPTASVDVTPATCDQNNGAFSLDISGEGPFKYDFFKNNALQSTGVPISSLPLNVGNLEAATYVLIISDANGCVIPAVATVEKNEITANTTTTLPSACGTEDGEICFEVSGGSGPYTLTSNQGIAPPAAFNSSACITSLKGGVVEVVITDANNCTKSLSFDLGEVEEPQLSIDSLTVTGINCPGEFGSIISKTDHPYQIFNENNAVVGVTPWMEAPAGTYTVVYAIGDCRAETEVTITGIADWEIVSTVQAESCEGEDGSISLNVAGAHGGYAFLWSNGDTTEVADSFSATLVYSVTITDSTGCSTTLEELIVENDCEITCEGIFYVDTFYVELQPGLTEICLPTEEPILDIFDLVLNGNEYTGDIGDCLDSTNFYGYGMLLNLGQPPFQLDSWLMGNDTLKDFSFGDIAELVAFMNNADPLGNWVLDLGESSISGGQPGVQYGSLNITHLGSNTTLSLQVNTVSTANPSIFVNQTPSAQVFIATDPVTGCADTLYINLLEGLLPEIDTIFVQVPVGGTDTLCIPTGELNGTPELMTNDCASVFDPAQVLFLGDTCLQIVGIEEGEMQACIVLCDDLGVCDTTILIISVVDTSHELVIYTGYSPNGDDINEYFRIKNIEDYPDNELIIFNRWGNRVYEQKSYSNEKPWTGYWGNKILPDGTYFYILDVVIDGKKRKFSGHVELRR
jgi:gliding motility-associated-like protein